MCVAFQFQTVRSVKSTVMNFWPENVVLFNIDLCLQPNLQNSSSLLQLNSTLTGWSFYFQTGVVEYLLNWLTNDMKVKAVVIPPLKCLRSEALNLTRTFLRCLKNTTVWGWARCLGVIIVSLFWEHQIASIIECLLSTKWVVCVVNMVSKIGGEPSSEFTMQTEDFPALPGAQLSSKSRSIAYQTGSLEGFGSHSSGDDSSQFIGNQSNSMSYRTSAGDKLESQSGSLECSSKKGIQTSGDGLVTNIPRGMVTDQFGIVGLLTFIRAAERDSNLVQLALGSDLQNLGLNLSSVE